ncbi:MAG TPA: HAMP domain-containing sensor histidine kinase [Anaerolineales bacterium]|nr:HAMP domain-containing sensor histidine kinase [Anaerolineales bacterium]
MSVSPHLEQIRPAWLERTSYRLARGEGVRQNFIPQLNQFYDLLLGAVETGDSSVLDPVIREWVYAQTRSEDDQHPVNLLPILFEILVQTQEVCVDLLTGEGANQAIAALLPHFAHASEMSVVLELGIRVGNIRGELLEIQGKLERLDRTKSNFISVAAHELKTPLTLLEGYTMMLKDVYPSTDQESQPVLLLKGMDNGTRRLKEIIDDMIDVSLIDNNLLNLNFQPLWLNRLVEILAGELAATLLERRQVLETNPFDGFGELNFGDSERLHQAFRNILINAIKFTPDGGTIRITGRKLPGFIETTISDTGIGIDPEDQSAIFEKFGRVGSVQTHSSGKTKFKGGGPGLGLPIARGIVEAHGGTIWVESPGYNEKDPPGSTFHILLPIRKTPPNDKTALLFEALQHQTSQVGSK